MPTIRPNITSSRRVSRILRAFYCYIWRTRSVALLLVDRNDVTKRPPIPAENLFAIQNRCREVDDDLRWLIALISDSGMRLAEVAGLLKADILLDHDIPHVSLKPHTWRQLKTANSE